MNTTIQLSEVFKRSWQCVKSQIWVLVGLCIGMCIISFTLGFLTTPLQNSIVGSIISYLISLIVNAVFSVGYVKNMFQTMDGEEPQFSAYLQSISRIINVLIGNILFGLIVLVGCIFLILPGIYLALRLMFFIQLIVDEDLSAIDALKRSWELTRGHVATLILLLLFLLLNCCIGIILFGVGIFVAIPLNYMMQCYVYRLLNTPPAVQQD